CTKAVGQALADAEDTYSVILNIKRSSAAYHSRNLSEKVFIGQVNLIKLGYHQGGMAGYGLRRLLVDENGIAKEILSFRKRKNVGDGI
ncbi:hypothetical protein ACT4UM_28120, partial [Bacillus sp. SS-TM]